MQMLNKSAAYDALKSIPTFRILEWGDRLQIVEAEGAANKFKRPINLSHRPSVVQRHIT